MHGQYNESRFASSLQNRSRGRGQGYSGGMNSTSFTHFGEYQQSNQNQECMYPTDRVYPNYRTQIQMSAPWGRMGQQDIVRLSKTLAFLLRHGAEKLGFHFIPGGFLYVDELLKYHKPLNGFTLEQIKELVRTNDKQRFYLQYDDKGRLMIRANQGHTTVVEGLDLSPIYDSSEVQMVVHGTYYQAWDQIQNTGLSRMNRNHIHFAAGMPGESGVISGMRKSCEVVIELDLEKALKARIPFFRSANNVILSPGNEKGFIPPTFFKRVFDRHSGEDLTPLDFLSVQVAAERLSQRCHTKRVREDQSEDEYQCKKRRSSCQTARYKKEGSTSQSGTLKSKKDDGKFGKLQNEKDKEETKQMRSKDEKGDREKSRSDRDEKEERISEPQNENERNMARPMRAQDEKEEISKSHSTKRKERTEQVRREDEKEVGETSMNRSGEGKGEGKKLKFYTGEEQMKETKRQLKAEDNKVEVELRYGQWQQK